MPRDTSCLFSILRNVSGSDMFFGFLPPHGKQLANQAEVAIPGNVVDAMFRGNRYCNRRFASLKYALGENTEISGGKQYLEIVKTAAVFLEDIDTDETKILILNDGAFQDVTPCLEESISV